MINLNTIFVLIIFTWLTILTCVVYFVPLSTPVTHTYAYPSASCINQLTTNRWAFESVRIGLWLCLFSLVPWSIVMMMWTKDRLGWIVHILCLCLMIIWGLVIFSYDISDMAVANVAPNDPNFRASNFARDTRWCNLYGGLPGTSLICCNIAPCTGPGLLVDSLGYNGPFVFRFAINIGLILLMCLDVYYSSMWQYAPERKSK